MGEVTCKFFCEGHLNNRNNLFKESLLHAQTGKVLYILREELNELPQLSQDMSIINKHYLKKISFLYAATLEALIESLIELPNWQNVPHAIMLEDLGEYCGKNEKHKAYSLIALLLDTAISCSKELRSHCNLYISINVDVVGEDYCNSMKEMYELSYT